MAEPVSVSHGAAEPFDKASTIAAKKAWRDHLARADGAAPVIRIGLAASFTTDPLVPFFGAALLSRDTVAEFKVGPYSQLFQTCLDPRASFGGACDVIVLLWRLEDLMLDEITRFLSGDHEALREAKAKLASVTQAIGQLRNGFSGLVVAGVPPYPTGVAGDLLALDNAGGLGAFHRALVGQFVDQIGQIEGVRLIDLDAVQRQVGLAVSFDARHWYLYRQPFTDAFLNTAGRQLGRIIMASRRAAKKCVVLDADN